MVISHSVTFWCFKAMHMRIFMVDLMEAAVISGLQFIFQLPPWCQIWLWKLWLIEAIAETSLKSSRLHNPQLVLTRELEINLFFCNSFLDLDSNFSITGIKYILMGLATTKQWHQHSFLAILQKNLSNIEEQYIYIVTFISSLHLPVVCIQWISLFLSLFLLVFFPDFSLFPTLLNQVWGIGFINWDI